MIPYRDWLAFDVEGRAMPAGSKTRTRWGIRECGTKENLDDKAAWRAAVSAIATKARNAAGLSVIPKDVPIELSLEFRRPRPASHYGAKGVKPKFADARPTQMPDSVKLTRSTEDAMTGVVWTDDSSICDHILRKRYALEGEPTGCRVVVRVADGIGSGCVGCDKSTVQASG